MERHLTVGVSSRALFDLEREHKIFMKEGPKAYVDYQIAHERDILQPGPAFSLIRSLLALNQNGLPQTEVVIMSKNSADAGLRIFYSIEHYGLDITRAALTTGAPMAPYLKAFHVDLYLSASETDVQEAVSSGVAAGIILAHSRRKTFDCSQIRIAFDGDAVLFDPESELIFQTSGFEAFCKNEKEHALIPLKKGPFAHFLKTISQLQQAYPVDQVPIRTALVTARSAPAHERVIRTLQAWNVRIDEAFFLGGADKREVLQAFGADIFFDDSEANTTSAAEVVLAVRVPTPCAIHPLPSRPASCGIPC